MIEVRYLDGLGNRMFQYCFGRILALRLGYCLAAAPLEGFPATSEKIEGADYSDRPEEILLGHFSDKTKRQEIDLEKLAAQPAKKRIIVEGYFQRYSYYQPYKEQIRSHWFKTFRLPPADPRDIVMHVRRGDAVLYGLALPFSYYEEALSRVRFRKLFICTDTPDDPFFLKFKKFSPEIISSKNPMDDLHFIMSFRKIIQSASTFSWWAGFLSEAEEIIAPLPLNGHWSKEWPEIDLRVTDETRYTYLYCREIYRRTLREKGIYYGMKLKQKVQNLVKRHSQVEIGTGNSQVPAEPVEIHISSK